MLIEVDEHRLLPRDIWMALVKARAGFRCERCGETEGKLNAHHRDRDRLHHRLSNGECLCARCHAKEHAPDWKPRMRARLAARDVLASLLDEYGYDYGSVPQNTRQILEADLVRATSIGGVSILSRAS